MTTNEITLQLEDRYELLRSEGYLIEGPLGQGRFGSVLLARDDQGRRVAIKTTFVTPFDVKAIEYAEQEIRALQLLDHPNVVKLHRVLRIPVHFLNTRFNATGYTLYALVLEYAEQGNLFQYIIKRGHLEEGDALRVMKQVICAVEACHEKNIVHRDIKAENVFVDSDDNVLLGDFGLSTFFRYDAAIWQSCGSLDYAAPEIVRGGCYIGPEVDVWSLGVLLYGCVCGYLPFKRSSREAIADAIKRGHYAPLPPHVPQGARNLIAKMLVVDQSKRIKLSDLKNDPWLSVGGWDIAPTLPVELAVIPVDEAMLIDDVCEPLPSDAKPDETQPPVVATATAECGLLPGQVPKEPQDNTTRLAQEELLWRMENKRLVRYLRLREYKLRVTKARKWLRKRATIDAGSQFEPPTEPQSPVVRWS